MLQDCPSMRMLAQIPREQSVRLSCCCPEAASTVVLHELFPPNPIFILPTEKKKKTFPIDWRKSGSSSKPNNYVTPIGTSSARPSRRGDCALASVAAGCCGRRVSGCAMHWLIECRCVFGRRDALSVPIGPPILILCPIDTRPRTEK